MERHLVPHDLGDHDRAIVELEESLPREEADAFALVLPLVEDGTLTCKNFLNFDPFG